MPAGHSNTVISPKGKPSTLPQDYNPFATGDLQDQAKKGPKTVGIVDRNAERVKKTHQQSVMNSGRYGNAGADGLSQSS